MARIKMLTGVVEVGLFCHMAKAAYFGNPVSLPFNLIILFSELTLDGFSGWELYSKAPGRIGFANPSKPIVNRVCGFG